MPIAPKTRGWMLLGISIACFLGMLLFLGGVLQAACLFSGDRAIRNVEFWGALSCLALLSSLTFGALAIRAFVGARNHVAG
jgi:hypothetical protein